MSEAQSRKDQAVAFINHIRTMDADVLNALIMREVGEDLAQFFLNYSANLISKDPVRVLENTSSLMLMGYLIHASAAGPQLQGEPRPTQPTGEA